MRVPGIVFGSEKLLPDAKSALQQVANVATLPGIVDASYAMPDVHWGYGFPIGGVAATDIDNGGVISPGGVGFDISCGVRLLISPLLHADIRERRSDLMDALAARVPRGLGRGALWRLSSRDQLDQVLRQGPTYAVQQGYGVERDLERCEGHGELAQPKPGEISERALERGSLQVGSLGSGNHFLEVQVVDAIYDQKLADGFELHDGQVCVMIHCGSRGLGHQICSDHVKAMLPAMARYGIEVPDRQLACVPVQSPEGQSYMSAMAAAANYGRANRQLLAEAARDSLAAATGTRQLDLLYDVSHNLAEIETHALDGVERRLCVHRKGATRALPPGHPNLPSDLRETGQPVLIPGSMGTASYVLSGVANGGAFHSTCHGAGRTMSRHEATRRVRGEALRAQLERSGISVRAESNRELAEEAPFAYKDVDEVVRICEQAGLARRVARLRPLGVVKG
jgi:tRNA-splicing ligase RtcB (3'-phosphate/5'-hydroxy nucleic acid ligase)